MSFLFFLAAACAGGPSQAPEAGGIRLVVVLAVDQMRADFVDRFAPMLEGGLGRLLREGAVFTSCTLDHAFTETGPGHAALLSGRNPGSAGIVENNWFDRASAKEVYCTGDPDARGVPAGLGSSPARLLGEALGDWMKRANPRSKVVSIGGKDRAAVLMGGKKPDGVYWASEQGFATSSYYRAELPGWLAAWNAKKPWEAFAGTEWEARIEEPLLGRMGVGPDDQKGERLWGGNVFPHRLPALGSPFLRALSYTPFSDSLVLAAAREAVVGESLGADADPDLLAIGLSAADYVGHACGPGSREVAEHFRSLDRALGEFLGFLEERAGKGRLLVALSSDHGVLELPERGGFRRVGAEAKAQLKEVEEKIGAALGPGDWIAFHDYRSVYLNPATCERAKVTPEKAAETAAKAFEALDWVAQAYTRADLSAAQPKDSFVAFYRHSFHPERSGDVFLRHAENTLVSPFATGTSHGNPYLCDRAVPLVMAGPGIAAGKRSEPVHTTDLAPTIAEALGVPAPDGLDGRSRLAILRGLGGAAKGGR